MKIRPNRPHGQSRALAYPALGDQLDAVAKGFRALMDQGFALPADTVAWVETTEAVKRRFPKTTSTRSET